MNLLRIVTGQVIRFMLLSPSEGSTLYGVNLVRALESHYGFLVSPKSIEDFNLANGITFRHGFFKKRIVIDQLKLYNNGILAEGAASTDDVSDFISDLIEWAANEAGIALSVDDANRNTIYHSIIHVEAQINFDKYIEVSNAICRLIDGKISSYGSIIPPFQMTGITFQPNIVGRAPTPFHIDRLANTPFDLDHYFSGSPLRTSDHLEVLAALEKAFMA